jgi:phage repressor protein C with HTH and peptisase S24 domain
MPAAVIPFRSASAISRGATWSLLEIARPGLAPEQLGILLVDDKTGQLSLRTRDAGDFRDLEEQDADYLAALATDLEAKAREPGPGAGHSLLDFLEDCLSGFLRIGDRTAIEYSGDAGETVNRLFDQYVDSEVRPFVTHLPLYGLRAAATRFGEEFDRAEMSEPDAWVRAPRGVRLAEGMFVAQVVGRSMEPLIPEGSYCLFRGPVVGSRQGKRLLIEQTGGRGTDHGTDLDSRYTVKRYTSVKKTNDDGTWQHERIRLEPLNPEFEAFELGEGDFRVIAEFVQVMPS